MHELLSRLATAGLLLVSDAHHGTDCLGPARAYSGVNTSYNRVYEMYDHVTNTQTHTVNITHKHTDDYRRLNRLNRVKQPSQHAPL